MVAYYDFEDNGAGTTIDNVGSYTGTLEGDAFISTGKYGSGVNLNGTGYVDGTHQPSFEVAQGTIMAWVNPDTGNHGEAQIAGVSYSPTWDTPHHGLQSYYRATGNGLGTQANSEGIRGQTTWGNPPQKGEWNHLAGSFDGRFLRIYLNGVETGNAYDFGFDSSIYYFNSPHLTIGARNADDPGNFFVGMIDEVKLFDTALDASEIMDQMTADAPVSPAVEKQWRLDASGDWNSKSNWVNGIPDNNTETAVLGDAIASPQTIFTNTDVTVQRIQIVNSNAYAIAGYGNINLDAGTASASSVQVLAGSHEFQAPLNLHSDTDVTIATASKLSLINALDLGGNTLNKAGPGELAIRSDLLTSGGTIIIQDGTVTGNGTVSGDVSNGAGLVSPGNRGAGLTSVPEPMTILLVLSGFVCWVATARR